MYLSGYITQINTKINQTYCTILRNMSKNIKNHSFTKSALILRRVRVKKNPHSQRQTRKETFNNATKSNEINSHCRTPWLR